ncbi:acyltransferase family protein [Cellulomonas iranensis]|uniref:Peptidoglycan/LPS O-acetylase OafA/YrhL n=1 Tax=Cellulomonas iranensis TaxID=76862 RepID=A0ABU0GG55_9CELL|nr:acyltransferase [Cellulomonas iranensis]MDQ0424073.1 peptidoglycan/LPS O-acetylase OafA/YrhL [Cellulomonas iranensis]
MHRASRSADQPAGAPHGRLDALTGLRFLAALVVVVFHLSLNRFFLDAPALVDPLQGVLRNGGWLGVTFFFVLSGFVLTWSARPGDTPGRFLWRRVAKIVPNHVVTFAVALAVAGLGGALVWEAGANLLLLHSWVPRDTAFFSINHPSWSLSAEMVFYALFPVTLPLVARVPRRHLVTAGAALVVVVVLLPLVARQLPVGAVFGPAHAQSPLLGASVLQVWSVYAFPLVRFLEFALGMLAARAVREGALPRVPVVVALGLVAAGYLLSLVVPVLWTLDAVFVLPVTALVVAVAQAPTPPAVLTTPLAVRLGEISFALYMVHDIVLTATRRFVPAAGLPPLGAALLVALVLAVSLGAAWALWRWVETPANTRLRALRLPSRDARRRPAAPAAPAVPAVVPLTVPATASSQEV